MTSADSNLEDLQSDWKQMFQMTLPSAASIKSSTQPKWPVHVDHCFARIILDNIVGGDTPWMTKIKSPAYKHMSKEQLVASIELGQRILDGEADLVELDNRSLELRGKDPKMSGKSPGLGKRKRGKEEDGGSPNRKITARESSLDGNGNRKSGSDIKVESSQRQDDLTPHIKKIALSHETSFRKKVLTALCQVPRGRYTTYGVMSKHLSSSPRAVGNALRNNPFAPEVPCHRVLASGGGLGGFMGSWGRNGKEGLNDDKKRKLLRDEGVRFDGKGKVVGSPWEGFK